MSASAKADGSADDSADGLADGSPVAWASRIAGWLARLLRSLVVFAVIVFALWVGGCMERQFYYPDASPTPVPAGFPGAEAVTFASGDGTRLHGWFLPAQGAAPRDAPTILHVHGNAGNIESHLGFSQALPRRGLNLFIFDYRGYGQSGGTARARNDLIADTDAALDALLARPDIDPSRVGMFGHSLGGAIGLNVMVDRPEIKAAVIEASFTSWRDVAAAAVSPGSEPGFIARVAAGALIRDHCRPDEAIARINRPILVVHGDADPIVPVAHGRQLAAAAPRAEMLELPGGDHNTLRDTHPELDDRIVNFFRLHLQSGEEVE